MTIYADTYNATTQAIADAISASVDHDTIEIIETAHHRDALHGELFEACEDYVAITGQDNRIEGDVTEIRESWGIDVDDNEWRVHLHISR